MEPATRQRRRGGEKRKTGCQQCKARHIRCDEKLPACSHCERLGLVCQPANIILHSTWSSIATAPQDTSSSRSGEQEVAVPINVNALSPPLGSSWSSSPPDSSATLPLAHALVPLTDEAVQLLQLYNTQLALWMDLCDHDCTYQREVGRLALRSELMLKCICAFSAQHLSLLAEGSHWQPIATRYYGEALSLLIQELAPSQPQAYTLAAAVLLGSYEVVAAHGHEHQRHLQGAFRLIRLRGINAQSTGLDRATFWIYVRHELFIALSNERPVNLHPNDWVVKWPEPHDAEDCLANFLLWLAARTINVIYSECDAGDLQLLKDDIAQWYDATSVAFKGIAYGQADCDGLRKHYFSSAAAASAMMWYHLISLFLLAKIHQSDSASVDILVQKHATSILCVGVSDIPASVRCFSTFPVLFAGKHVDAVEKKFRAWTLLDNIEKELGYDTSRRVELVRETSQIPIPDPGNDMLGGSELIKIV